MEPLHSGAALAARAIWTATSFERFKTTQIRTEGGVSAREATRILEQLERDGWIERADRERSIWQAGPMIRRLDEMGDHPVLDAGDTLGRMRQ